METIEVNENQLIKITQESGLEETKGKSYATEFMPFSKMIREASDKLSSLNIDNPSEIDSQIARTLRLPLVKNRTDAMRKKDELKASMIIENKLIDSLYGVINNGSKLIENKLEQIEKHAELKEKARKAELKETRLNILMPFEVETSFYDLENMPDDQFETLFTGIKKTHDDKVEAEKLAIELEIKRKEEERIENERIKSENDKLKKEAAERERLAEIERKKQEKILQAEREKAAEEKRKQDAIIEAERKKKDEAENKLKAERAERERQVKLEKEKIEREQKEKEELEEKRLAASDSEKFIQLASDIKSIQIPKVQSKESKQLIKLVESELENIVKRLMKNKV